MINNYEYFSVKYLILILFSLIPKVVTVSTLSKFHPQENNNNDTKTMSGSPSDVQPAVIDAEKDRIRTFLGKTITKITEKENEIKEIVVIQQAEFNANALTGEQNGFKNWIDAKKGGLDNYLQELNTDLKKLEAEKSRYIGLLENATEVYLLLFICNAFR